jgi:uncharacterized protein (TIGR00251 family)
VANVLSRISATLVRMRTLRIKVKPNSRVEELIELADGSWEARVKAPPVDGKANTALIALVATHFGVRKAQVTLKSGAASRLKLIQIID